MIESLIVLAVIIAAFAIASYLAGKYAARLSASDKVIDNVAEAKKVEESISNLDASAQRDRLRKYSK